MEWPESIILLNWLLCVFQNQGISFEEMQLFSRLVEEIADVEMALSMYLAAGASITACKLT